MKYSIFRKAESLKDKVIKTDEKEEKSYFSFKDIKDPPQIVLVSNGKITYISSCTCRHCSIFHGLYPYVECSYKNAVRFYLGQ